MRPGSSSSRPAPTDNLRVRLRRTSCPRGTISLLTNEHTSVQSRAKTTGQRMTVSRFTPHARMAAISLSAERRENTRMDDTSNANGTVHCIVSGKLTSAKRPTRSIGTPCRI